MKARGLELSLALLLLVSFQLRAEPVWEDPQHSNSVVELLFSSDTTNLTYDTSAVATNHADINYGTANEPDWVAFSNGVSAHYEFDGNDYLATDYSPDLKVGTNAFSISAWIQPDALAGTPFSLNSSDGTDLYVTILLIGDGRCVYVSHSPGFGPVSNQVSQTATGVMQTGEWQHLAAVRTGDAAYIYIDGVLKGTPTAQPGVADFDKNLVLGVGAWRTTAPSTWGSFFDGEIDEVKFYSRALSSNEVHRLWLNTKRHHGDPSKGSVLY